MNSYVIPHTESDEIKANGRRIQVESLNKKSETTLLKLLSKRGYWFVTL
jgi:hypothetical protein